MSHEVFTDPWAQAWAEEIAGSETYRLAAATWQGSMTLELGSPAGIVSDAAQRAVFVDLEHGSVRQARAATADDLDEATFALRADMATWRKVLDGKLDPILGLMSGKLKLRRGSLGALTPYMKASKELVACAARVDSSFPDSSFPEESPI